MMKIYKILGGKEVKDKKNALLRKNGMGICYKGRERRKTRNGKDKEKGTVRKKWIVIKKRVSKKHKKEERKQEQEKIK